MVDTPGLSPGAPIAWGFESFRVHALVAEWHTHCTKDAGFESSNLSGRTPQSGEIGIHGELKLPRRKACGSDSRL